MENKQIEELAEKAYPSIDQSQLGHLVMHAQRRAFIKGYQSAMHKWVDALVLTPIATESGDWDGLRSDLVLAVNKSGDYVIARVYEGFMDGHRFVDWVDSKGNILDLKAEQIVKWQNLPD